jgi:Met-zincin
MDYPHPLSQLKADGSLDLSQAYTNEIGAWDKVTIAWGYQHFPPGTDERAALAGILDEAWARDVRYMTNQDLGAHPRVNQWSNGADAAAELTRMLAVRRAALTRFGEQAIRRGTPMALLEETLVPLYLHHRYQVEATTSVLGGQHFIYALRGDGREPTRWASAAEQKAALDAIIAALAPAELRLPDALLKVIPPRPDGYDTHRELFPRYTGLVFDAVAPAVVAAEHTLGSLFTPERAARLVQQHALDPALPGLGQVIDQVVTAVASAPAATPYEQQIKLAVQRVLADRLMALAAQARMPQVRAFATDRLGELATALTPAGLGWPAGAREHTALIEEDIARFLDRPLPPMTPLAAPAIPPGAPIGDPGLDWLATGVGCDGEGR